MSRSNRDICHTCSPHRKSGEHRTHEYIELPLSIETRGYDAYFSPKNQPFEFVLEGDGGFNGGFINWAYSGDFTRNDRPKLRRYFSKFNDRLQCKNFSLK